jgi:hypothetical protein
MVVDSAKTAVDTELTKETKKTIAKEFQHFNFKIICGVSSIKCFTQDLESVLKEDNLTKPIVRFFSFFFLHFSKEGKSDCSPVVLLKEKRVNNYL